MTAEKKTHWKSLQNPDYIGAFSLQPDEDLTVVIDYVIREQITGTGGKKEECSVAHLKNGVKPLILNVTNSKSIAKLYGNFVEEWAGKPITLFASTTKFGGEVVDCLRIRPTVAERTKPSITDARLSAALKKIADGEYTVVNLRKNFALNEIQDKLVTDTVASLAAGEPAPDAPPIEATEVASA